jgi:hypothetical protein
VVRWSYNSMLAPIPMDGLLEVRTVSCFFCPA